MEIAPFLIKFKSSILGTHVKTNFKGKKMLLVYRTKNFWDCALNKKDKEKKRKTTIIDDYNYGTTLKGQRSSRI